MKKSLLLTNIVFFAVVSVLLFYLCATTPIKVLIKLQTGNLNITCMALCVVVYLVLIILMGRKDLRFSSYAVIVFNALLVFFLLFSMLQEHMVYDAGSHLPVEYSSPLWMFLIVIAAIGLSAYFSSGSAKLPTVPHTVQRLLVIVLTAIIVGIAAYNQYTPNTLLNSFDSHHFTAYVNSIWNVFWGQPYTETITSIYGHYGFIYYPFLKAAWFLGARNLFKVYFALSMGITGACIIMFVIALLSLVKKTPFRLMGILGIGYINCARCTNVYHQLFPHRVLPMAVTALMMALWMRARRKKLVSIIGYAICALLLIWSTEYGLFSTIAWSALNCCSLIQSNKKKDWFAVAIHILAIPITFVLSLLLCGLFNTLLGGSMISVKEFIFPLQNRDYMNGYLQVSLPVFPSAWMSIMVGLLVFLGIGLSDTALCSQTGRKNDRTAVFFGLAVLGLGSVTYAINRAVYGNFYIIMYLMAIIIAVIAEDEVSAFRNLAQSGLVNNTEGIQKYFLSFTSVCVLVIITISCVANIPNTVNREIADKDDKENRKMMAALQRYSDGDAYAVGNAAISAFAMLGWDPQVYLMDLPDMSLNPAAKEEMVDKMGALYGKELFISFDDFGGPLPASYSSAYRAKKKIHFGPHTILYCKPVQLLRRNPRAKMAK